MRVAIPRFEEPDARVGHVRICGSRGWATTLGHPARPVLNSRTVPGGLVPSCLEIVGETITGGDTPHPYTFPLERVRDAGTGEREG